MKDKPKGAYVEAETLSEQGLHHADRQRLIRESLRVAPLPWLPEILVYTAHPASGLRRLASAGEGESPPPYWAYQWAGGAALARYLLDRPKTVRGRRVLDLGAGSGIVGMAAAKAGAREVIAADVDPYAVAVLELNAAANGVAVTAVRCDLTAGPPPAVDLVAVGDLFYDRALAGRVTAFLDRCVADGIDVLVGDPGRAFLPRKRLSPVAEYRVPDVGNAGARTVAGVFSFDPH